MSQLSPSCCRRASSYPRANGYFERRDCCKYRQSRERGLYRTDGKCDEERPSCEWCELFSSTECSFSVVHVTQPPIIPGSEAITTPQVVSTSSGTSESEESNANLSETDEFIKAEPVSGSTIPVDGDYQSAKMGELCGVVEVEDKLVAEDPTEIMQVGEGSSSGFPMEPSPLTFPSKADISTWFDPSFSLLPSSGNVQPTLPQYSLVPLSDGAAIGNADEEPLDYNTR
ncbi:hypothetical protein CC1G_12606 [Coprinopsis cinerea okayama7|uniref:Zn(2)-C6 fungal-type domain-containing protein n=1 Tax=Coprinopsis cinerea (strain Okayama-7 / 130 / ATCC MYA-4618 / FGSC 9003) TaxID=240176 RepID=A8NP68_COPC7|nr:hypothetical protein CC1G_12606 [Coprinopsis cinerea okayama7\|eukprot:XP_001835278.2 hypothetical protein CC1G_12606 [Coprinopsis cinerea okayama7\